LRQEIFKESFDPKRDDDDSWMSMTNDELDAKLAETFTNGKDIDEAKLANKIPETLNKFIERDLVLKEQKG